MTPDQGELIDAAALPAARLCPYYGTAVRWIRTAASAGHSSLPIDALPSPQGNVAIVSGLAVRLSERNEPSHTGERWRAHSLSCGVSAAELKVSQPDDEPTSAEARDVRRLTEDFVAFIRHTLGERSTMEQLKPAWDAWQKRQQGIHGMSRDLLEKVAARARRRLRVRSERRAA